jgi:hypothetical protein
LTTTAKPKRVRYSGVGVFADGTLLSRVQSLSSDTDLATENLNELTNANIVEVSEGLPTISVSVETNEFGSCQNLYALCGRNPIGYVGNNAVIDETSFDGTSVDFSILVEQDNVLKRSSIIEGAFCSAVAWSFDVGGVATENYTFEADNRIWYFNQRKETYSVYAYRINDFGSGYVLLISGVNASSWGAGIAVGDLHGHNLIKITEDNVDIVYSGGTYDKGNVTFVYSSSYEGHQGLLVSGSDWDANTFASDGSRYRVIFSVDAIDNSVTNTRIPTTGFGTMFPGLSSSAIGGIRKGMIQILLASGANMLTPYSDSDEMLRLQTCSVDADLSREALEELGNYKAFDRSLTFPITVTVGFSALSSDLEEWAKFAHVGFTTATDIDVTDFVRAAGVVIYIYDDNEGAASRNLLKKIAVENLRVTNESFSVDQGGNATQEFTCTSDNFAVSGGIYA